MALPLKIALSVGEVSADEHAVRLIAAIKKLSPNAQFRGMGGRHCRESGVETIVDSEKSASVMGFGDVLASLTKILAALKALKKLLIDWKPDLLILIDFPDFNLRLAKFAKKLGIKVCYFIPPSIWAWREGRVNLIKRDIERAALIYPFEEEFYRKHGYKNALFVGHPFSEELDSKHAKPSKDKISWCREQALDPEKPLFAILPGSRKKELDRHMPALNGALKLLLKAHPEVQIVFGLASNLREKDLVSRLSPELKVHISYDSLELFEFADAALLKSGTSNLQAAFFELPFTMFFKAPLISEAIVRTFVKVKEYSIVNVIRAHSVAELIQREVTPKRLAQEMQELLFDKEKRSQLKLNLKAVTRTLAAPGQNPQFTGCADSFERAAKFFLS